MRAAPEATSTSTSDRLTTLLSYGALLLLGYLVFMVAEPFLVPLAWSAVLAIFFFPIHLRITKKVGTKHAALVSTIAVTLLLIVPALVVLFYTTRQAIDAASTVQNNLQKSAQPSGQGPSEDLQARGIQWLRSQLPAAYQNTDFSEPLRQGAEKTASFLAAKIGSLLKNLLGFVVGLFICIFALFFMFRDSDEIVRGVRHLIPFDPEIQEDMLKESKDLIFASVAVGLLVAAIQGFLGGLSFAITGIPTPIFWGVLIAFFSLVPVVGSALIFVPAALWLGLTGHWGKGLIIVLICGGVSTIVDNIVRPMLLRNRTRLNELLLFIGVLGGLEVFGLLGLVAGPTIVAAAMGVFRVYMDHRDHVIAERARSVSTA